MGECAESMRVKIMERKRFLELCRENAVRENSVKVIANDIKYHPVSLNIWFNDKGETRNSAVLHDIKANCVVYCDIVELSELTN
jgi:hypothetical protein